ncbi:hypothetical protein [Enterovirga sp. CN4-39]|uniref:hypothetical protein n=1 Tax=Enterovirga sp. CN4-39 TaxID=3400910 RepID=UPI003C09A07E
MSAILAALDAPPPRARARQAITATTGDALPFFALRTAVNATRFGTGLKSFREDEFGLGPEAPSRAHIQAVNRLLAEARQPQIVEDERLSRVARNIGKAGDAQRALLLHLKERNQALAGEAEKIWEFYLNLFSQRAGPFRHWLRGIDRIALDCYQAVYLGLGKARPIPSPAPFAYMEAGFGPATFRRGVKLSMLGQRQNPFPLVKVPYHRLLNPWSLGAVPHEVAHNLQNDLGLWAVMPRRIKRAFTGHKLPDRNAEVWQRWHKETYADLTGVLLIGPAYVGSLMDVVGRSREQASAYSDDAVHPTPLIRVPLNIRLLERIGFGEDASAFRRAWDQLYPASVWRKIPGWVTERLQQQIDTTLDAMCFENFDEYGDKALAQVIRFEPKHATLVREAALRLEAGTSTGVLPERFLIAAARIALVRKRTDPEVIHRNFYDTLGR